MKTNTFVLLSGIFLVTLFLVPVNADAASLYIDPPFTKLYKGDSVKLSIRLDTEESTGECINAVDAVISYGQGIEPVDTSTGGSIFSIWVEEPTIDKENRTITFAGGIPNGYCGRVTGDPRLTNTLAEIIFRSPGFSIGGGTSVDSATVSFTEQTSAYLNDGLGTKADLRTLPTTIDLASSPGQTLQNPWKDEIRGDTTSPQEFSILLQKDDNAFGKKYYIVFNATDKETGIDQYQVMEEPLSQFGTFQWGRADAPWITARSPYILEDQSLNSIIRVKAIDKSGNEYIDSLIPEDSLRGFSGLQMRTLIIVGFGIVLLLVVIIIGMTVFKRITQKKRQEASVDVDDDEVDEEEFDEGISSQEETS